MQDSRRNRGDIPTILSVDLFRQPSALLHSQFFFSKLLRAPFRDCGPGRKNRLMRSALRPTVGSLFEEP
jgi:hypothetical protein